MTSISYCLGVFFGCGRTWGLAPTLFSQHAKYCHMLLCMLCVCVSVWRTITEEMVAARDGTSSHQTEALYRSEYSPLCGSVEMENCLKLNPTNHPKTMTCSKKFSISPGCQKSHTHSLWRAAEIWNTSRTTSDVIKQDFITTSTGITVKARVPQVPQGIAKANAATWTFVWNIGGKLEARVGVRKLAGLLWGCNIYWVQQARIPQCSDRLSPGFLRKRKTRYFLKNGSPNLH